MLTAPQKYLIDVELYYFLGKEDKLPERQVELIKGEIIYMSPIGSLHASYVDKLNMLLRKFIKDETIVRIQNPLYLDSHSEPQPDILLLKPKPDFYAPAHPRPSDVLLLIEVADSSAEYDRLIKAPLYAQAGIAEYWLIDLNTKKIEVYRNSTSEAYQSKNEILAGHTVEATQVNFKLSHEDLFTSA